MNVLMTTDTVGGVWTYAIDLARALRPHGVQVALATMGALPSPGQRTQAAAVGNVTLYESAFKLEWMPDPWADLTAAGQWLLDLEQQTRPNVVHLNGYVHGALPWRSPTLMVAHSCVLSWWQAVKGEPAPAEWSRYATAVRDGIAAADLLVAPTAAMLAATRAHYGPVANGRVIHNGRDAALFAPATKQPFVLSAGRLWDQAKNVAALDRVALRVPWPIRVAGDATGEDGCSRSTLSGVSALGRLGPQAMAEQLSKAAVYAMPARYEPFGLSILEAAFCGCALVVGDVPSLREVWDDAAIYVDPNDDGSLADALGQVVTNARLRNDMGERARARAQRYTLSRMGERYIEAYAELTASDGVAPDKQPWVNVEPLVPQAVVAS